jgi:hypothetical protein
MRRRSVSLALLLVLTWAVSSASGIEYAVDQLEKKNPGGSTASLKSFDKKGIKDTGKELTIDIWLKDVPEELISAGFWLTYDPAQVSIVKVEMYDGKTLPGPWDSEMTRYQANPQGPGTYSAFTCNLGCTKPDKKGDIIIGRVQISCQDKCTKPVEINPIATKLKDFDSVVGCNGKLYDAAAKPASFTIH